VAEDVVVPGEVLGVIEEFTPGSGAYEELGVVYSSVLGSVVRDMGERRVSVRSIKGHPLTPRRGDVVVGMVVDVKRDLAEVDIHQVEGGRRFSNPFKALIHVSMVSTHFIERLTTALWPGDMVRAKVLVAKDPYVLSMRERGLGVILAFCSKCRAPLILRGARLSCPSCGSTEQRRVSTNYMLQAGRVDASLIKALM